MKILLVEDNPDDTFLALRILGKMNFTDVTAVSGGHEALEYIFSGQLHYSTAAVVNKPDLILLDMRMPGIDGLDFLRLTQAARAAHKIPVAVITSSPSPRDMNDSMELGAMAFIQKPVQMDNLGAMISRMH